MSLWDKVKGAVAGAFSKIASFMPFIESIKAINLNEANQADVIELGLALKEMGEVVAEAGDALIEAVQEQGPAGEDITVGEAENLAHKFQALGDRAQAVVDRANEVRKGIRL